MQLQLSSVSAEAFLERLGEDYALAAPSSEALRGAYYDTFDWRLYLKGLALFVERNGSKSRLHLVDRLSGEEVLVTEGSGEPGMIESLPVGGVRDRLAPIIQMRRLLPLVEVRGERRDINLLNKDEKTVVRLELLTSEAIAESAAVALPSRLLVTSLRGYGRDADRFLGWLDETGMATVGENRHLDAALGAIGRQGGDYSSKLNYKLVPGERADDATRHIMLDLLATLEGNIDGSAEDIDSEYLHDLRVAVRRTRSALTQIKGVFPPEVVERYKQRFAWIGQITGPTRDLHVYLLKFEDYRDSLPAAYRDALDPFHRYLEQHQISEHRKLRRALGSVKFKTILSEWRALMESAPEDAAEAPNAGRTIKALADERIHKMAKRVLREGRAIDDDSPAEDLHELRKSCKKLRYLMEFFQSLYPKKDIGSLIKAIKVLLDNLGDFQDLEVQALKLEGMAEELRKSRASTHSLLAMGMLIEGLLQRQQRERERFANQFRTFDSSRNQALLVQLFKPESRE